MKFWEALKEVYENGKTVKCEVYRPLKLNNEGTLIWPANKIQHEEVAEIHNGYLNGEFKIIENPEFYWQWRLKSDGTVTRPGFENEKGDKRGLEKHAGPWIKTEDGFKKHETWEQY